MPRTKLPRGSVPLTFRLPRAIKKLWADKARREKLSLAEFIRRALRRELEAARGRKSRHGR
jgi:predicted HicB family RNase H-like nuclease